MCTQTPLTADRDARLRHQDEPRRPHLPCVGRRPCFALLLAVSVLAGCAGVAGRGTGDPVPYADAALLAAEIRRTGAEHRAGETAYDAVRLLRPSFLRIAGHLTRGQVELPETAVYVDGARVGGLEALRLIPLRNVSAIRLVKPLDAVTAFGRGHGGGALMVEVVR